MIDIADLCAAISTGQVRAYPSSVPGYRRRATTTRRPERKATGTCRCGKPAYPYTCGSAPCRKDHKNRWQNAYRARKREAREAIKGPTIFGPKPGGAT